MNAPTPFALQEDFDIGAIYVGQYVKASDLDGKTYTAIIVNVEEVDIADQDGSVRRRAALTLRGWPAKLLLNKTNYETISAEYGRRRAGWIDKQIEVRPDTCMFGTRSVPCIRVRVPQKRAPVSAIPGTGPAAPAAPAAAVRDAVPAQAASLPPLMTAGELSDDIPY